MNLIVFDLEWNIGYQPKTFLYHGTELTLRGEIIQIGAARINDRGDVLDTFEVNLKPHIFRKLQHHIAKVTGLSQGDLDAGLPMKEGLQEDALQVVPAVRPVFIQSDEEQVLL